MYFFWRQVILETTLYLWVKFDSAKKITEPIDMTLVVRPAKITDIDWLLSQLKQFAAFNKTELSLFGGPPETQHQTLSNLIRNHVLLICEKQPEVQLEDPDPAWMPVGLICGALHRHMFNPEIRCLTEYFWWVDPDHRNSRAGQLLFKEFDLYGKELADWVTFSLLENSPDFSGYLEKNGFRLIEKSYLKENKAVQDAKCS